MSPLLKAEALSILPARRYCQSQPWIWSCSVARSLLMFSVWYLGPIPISKGGPPGALTFWSAWRLSRPPACGISCQREQTTPLLQNIHPPPFVLPASLPFTMPPPSAKLPEAPVALTGSGAASHSQLLWPWWVRCLRCSVQQQEGYRYSHRAILYLREAIVSVSHGNRGLKSVASLIRDNDPHCELELFPMETVPNLYQTWSYW